MPFPNRNGRPTKLTPEMQERICTYLRVSATRRMAAQACGIAEETIWAWCKRHPEFAKAVEEAEQEAKLSLLACLHKQARNGSHAAATWLLERRGGTDFAPPTQRHELTIGVQQLEAMDDADLDAYIASAAPHAAQLGPGGTRKAS